MTLQVLFLKDHAKFIRADYTLEFIGEPQFHGVLIPFCALLLLHGFSVGLSYFGTDC